MSKETWGLGTLSRTLPGSLQYPTDPCVWDTLCMLTKQELVYFFSSCFKMSSSQNFWVMHWVFILCKCYYKELVWVIPNSVWNFRYYKILCKMFFFSFTNLSQGNFLYHPKFFIPSQVLHTARTPTELKQNLSHWPFFASFVKLLNIRLDECSLFLSHLKSVF